MSSNLFYNFVDYTNETNLDNFLSMLEQIKVDSRDKLWPFNQKEPIRSKLIYTLGQNSYGFRHQNLLIFESSGLLSGVSSSLSRGDVKTIFNKYCEFKVSYTSKAGTYSFWQVRLWQDLDGYIFKVIDRRNNFKIKYFCFTKDQIEEENSIQKPKATHGDKQVVNENTHIELTFRYDPQNSYEKDRWESSYLQEDVFRWLKKL